MADDKKIKITGEVKIDQAEAKSDLAELKAELAGFNAALANLQTGITLILRALASIAETMKSATDEAKKTTDEAEAQTDAANETAEATGKVVEETEKVVEAAEDASKAIDKAATATAEVAAETAKAADEAKDAAKAMDGISDTTEATAEAATEQADAIVDATGAVVDLAEETDKANVEAEKQPSIWRELADEFKTGLLDGIEQANDEQGQLNAKTETLRGAWQRIGHKAVDGLIAGIRGLAGYLASFIDDAGEFDKIFHKMTAQGETGVAKLKLAVVGLAGAMGEDLLTVAKAVNQAMEAGAGDGSLAVAQAALENYRVTGMDVARQIEVTTNLSKAFNDEMGDQADLIREVAVASQEAHISQELLWDGIATVAPRLKQAGGSLKDLVRITTTGLAAGLKAGENGLEGLEKLLNQLIKPTDEFGQKLVEVGMINTQSAPQWKALTDQVAAQKSEFEALNAEMAGYQRQSAEIGLLTTQATRAMEQFAELNKKREDGERLNRLERSAYRDLKRELESFNKELSEYDKAGRIIENADFRRLTTIEQMELRLKAAKTAQEDLNIASQEAQLDAQDMGNSLQTANTQLTAIAATMQAEIPNAIREAISQGGLTEFIAELSSTPAAMATLSGEVQTLVSAIGQSMSSLDTQTGTSTGLVTSLGNQFAYLHQRGVDGLARLKESFATMATVIMGPVTDAMNTVAQVIMEKLQQPFSDGSTIFEHIQSWATKVGATIIADVEAVASGDKSLGEVLKGWFRTALEAVQELWKEYAQPMVDSLLLALDAQMPRLRQYLIDQVKMMMSEAIGGAFDTLGRPLQDFFYNQMMRTQSIVDAYTGGVQVDTDAGSRQMAGPSSFSPTITVNGAGDPAAVANEVMMRMSQLDRLGYSGARLR